MDQTIVATALPAIVRDVGGRTAMGWVFASYTLAMTISMPVYGRLGDLRGRRSVFLVCLAGFVISSVACGLATTMLHLVGLRAIQGLAGGGVLVLSQAVVADAVPARHRGQFMAPVGLVFATASVVAPLVGGVLTDTVGWRWVFWVNLPLGVTALAMAFKSIPRTESAGASGKVDVPGAIVYAVAVTALVSLTGTVGHGLPWGKQAGAALLVMTVLATGVFVRRMLRHADPLIPVGVMKDRTITVSTWLGLTIGVAVFALVGYLPTIVQTVLDVPATASGALLLALIVGMMASIFGTSALISRTGKYRRLPVLGCAVSAGAMVALSRLDASWSLVHTAAWVGVLGIGTGCYMQLVTTMAQDAAPSEHVGSATSTVSLGRELGVTIGAAAIGSALATQSDEGGLFLALAGVLALGAVVSLLLPHREFAGDHPGAPGDSAA
ncbi:MFS transporter [Nostocoides sp. HKS02]|uniref:MFS transporter n=1 Tax=Nostocoides sp. HKS02 TaxID=1813880 RepID=UPI0018A83271|nr:MFS transporter [Tetrasphaera sp. HKS02]